MIVTGGGPTAIMNGLYFQGTSTATTQMKEAYAVSDLTGHKQLLMANIQYKGVYPVDQVDIPASAGVDLILEYKPNGLSIDDFLKQWGKFHIFIRSGDATPYERQFEENYIYNKLRQIPGAFGPRMTPRNDK
jgi:hypothetical protein